MGRSSVYFCNYTVGTGVYEDVPAICGRYGTKALLLGDENSLAAGGDKLASALKGSPLAITETAVYGKDCTQENIRRWADRARALHADMIFGMGGGKAVDTAKAAADLAGLPSFTFPTIASTCATTTALSVVYRESGDFDHITYFSRPPRHAFIDLDILAAAPPRYLRAGMGDTLGKYYECHFASRGDKLAHGSALGREISNMCRDPLLEHGVQALADCKAGRVTFPLEQAVLAVVVSTGLVSLLVLDEYNCAIAHSVDYGLILLPGFEERFLHGEGVAYGVLVQLAVDGDLEEARRLKAFLQALESPTTLKDMGLPKDRQSLAPALQEIVNGPDMEHIPYPVTEDMVYAAMLAIEAL